MNNCLFCKRIEQITNKQNPYFVKKLETGYVVIGDYQTYEGYTLFLCKEHISELHLLKDPFKTKYLQDLSLVGEAVFKAFKPDKLNYELLGNTERTHVHCHIFPRKLTDSNSNGPVWIRGRDVVFNEKNRPSPEKLKNLIESLTSQF